MRVYVHVYVCACVRVRVRVVVVDAVGGGQREKELLALEQEVMAKAPPALQEWCARPHPHHHELTTSHARPAPTSPGPAWRAPQQPPALSSVQRAPLMSPWMPCDR